MPKLKPTEKEERDRITRSVIRGNQERYGIKDEQMAKSLGLHICTYRDKLNHEPERIRLDELQTMSRLLKFTPIQAASLVLGRDLTTKEIKDFILM